MQILRYNIIALIEVLLCLVCLLYRIKFYCQTKDLRKRIVILVRVINNVEGDRTDKRVRFVDYFFFLFEQMFLTMFHLAHITWYEIKSIFPFQPQLRHTTVPCYGKVFRQLLMMIVNYGPISIVIIQLTALLRS